MRVISKGFMKSLKIFRKQLSVLSRDKLNKAFPLVKQNTGEGQTAYLASKRLALVSSIECESRYCPSTAGHEFLQPSFFAASTWVNL